MHGSPQKCPSPARAKPTTTTDARTPSAHTVTSDSNPIYLSWVAAAEAGPGRLGLVCCPGRVTTRQGAVTHKRSLRQDLERLRDAYGVTVLVCLLNDAELGSLGQRDYASQVAEAGLELIQYPIPEMMPPDSLQAAACVVDHIAFRMRAGQVLAMHCRAGVGRAGLMAACVLLRLGQAGSAAQAIRAIRARRCSHAIETRRQEDFVRAYATRLVQYEV